MTSVAIAKRACASRVGKRLQRWMVTLYERVGYAKAKVAIANKHARQVWAMLSKGQA